MKRFFAYATLLLLSLCLTVPALAAGPAITEGAAVTDLGGVLTAEELASLEDTAQSLADEYGCGVYALLLPDFTVYGYEDIFDFAQDVFEENALGLGDSQNGVLLAVSTETRDVSIAVHGDSGNTAFTDYGRRCSMTPFSPTSEMTIGTRVWSIIWTPAAIFSPRPQTARRWMWSRRSL